MSKRERLMGALEICSGARIGELAGAQSGHGCFANNMAIVTFVGGEGIASPPRVCVGDEFVEHLNETSKTGLGRVMCVRGETRGPARVKLADALRAYWAATDMPMAEDRHEKGWKVERPNWWVLQLSVNQLRFDPSSQKEVEAWLDASGVGQVNNNAQAIRTDLKRLLKATDPKEGQMFVNVVGGSLNGPAMDRASAELMARGVPHTVEMGPLLMKSAGVKAGKWVAGKRESIVPPMPILAKSTYSLLNRCLDRAYREMIAEGKVDLQLGDDRESPDWGHYTWRRLAAEACQAVFERGERSDVDVDLLMGWRLAKWNKQMRLHYSDRGVRTGRAHLTEMI